MSKTPTDDELLAAARELGVSRFAVDLPHLRLAIEAPTLAGAMRAMSYAPDSEEGRRKCLALRRRFPQPITDEVLRAAGFEPGLQPGRDWVQKCGQTMLVARRPEGSLWWVEVDDDRLHRVVECLRGLCEEEE